MNWKFKDKERNEVVEESLSVMKFNYINEKAGDYCEF